MNGIGVMTEENRCQGCNAELGADESGPVCAACMLEKGWGEDSLDKTIDMTPGRSFCGYEIVRRLGVGGMGVVYEARQQSLRRSVALKMILAPRAATESDILRFRQEAEAAARLDHPNIVEVYETGEFEGSPFFSMKYVEGARSLGAALAQGPFDPREAAKLVCETARAVAYAHHRGVIHRDIKPANILLDRDGRPCLVDFGLAKLFGDSRSAAEVMRGLSDDGRLIGTPHYMSPEQVQGTDITTATDIYSLGVVLYELLSGSPPFKSRSLNDILQDISHELPKPPGNGGKKVPRDLQVICLKCLRKQAKNRYGTADELADDLERWLEQRPIHARPSSRADRIAKWARRNPGVAALSPVVACLALVAMGLLWWQFEAEKKRIREIAWSDVKEIKSLRADDVAGRRWKALELIRGTAEDLDLLKGDGRRELRKELQNEAIAWLSTIDMRPSEDAEDTWVGGPGEEGLVRLSPDFASYAHVKEDGSIVVRGRSTDMQIPLSNPGTGRCVSLHFDYGDGLRLAAVYELAVGRYECTVWNIGLNEIILTKAVNGPDAVDFSKDGSVVYLAYEDSVVRVRLDDELEGESSVKTPFPVRILRLNQEGTSMAVTPVEGRGVALLDVETGDPIPKKTGPEARNLRVLSLEWNPRGRWLALAGDNGEVVIWDTEAGADNREISLDSGEQGVAMESVAWHPRGVLLATVSGTEKIYLWHVVKEELEVVLSGHMDRPQFSPESDDVPGGGRRSRLGPVLEGGQVSLLEVAEGQIVTQARGHSDKIIFGCWWRDLGKQTLSRIFATAGDDGVRLWNRRGFEKAFLPEPEARAAIFTGRGLVITGANGASIRSVMGGGSIPKQRELEIGRARRFGESGPCFGAVHDPVFQRLAVAAGDHIRIYEMPSEGSGSLEPVWLRDLPAAEHTEFVDISPDGKWLAAGTNGKDGEGVRVWDTTSWEEVKVDFDIKGSAHVVFFRDALKQDDWLVTSGGGYYKFYDVKTWSEGKRISTDLGLDHPGAISLSPRMPVFAVQVGRDFAIYGFHQFDSLVPDNIDPNESVVSRFRNQNPPQADPEGPVPVFYEFPQLMNPAFDTQVPVCFSPGGFVFVTKDTKSHLHLWDVRLLRESLVDLGLDLALPSFSSQPELPVIDTITVQDQ